MFLPENLMSIVAIFLETPFNQNSTTWIDSLEMHLSCLCNIIIYIRAVQKKIEIRLRMNE